MEDNLRLVIGVFYERPDGSIAFVYGSDKDHCLYSTLKKSNRKVNKVELLKTWKIREDLYDFPGTSDPRLPRDLDNIFDLLYDIKYYSEIYYALDGRGDFGSIKRIRKTMEEFNLTVESIEKILEDHNYDFPNGRITESNKFEER